MKKIKAGIIGGAGYTGGELLRLLLHHPQLSIAFLHSRSSAGLPVHSIHADLLGETELLFTSTIRNDIDLLFLCVGHGEAKKFLEENAIDDRVKIIDLSQDFRLPHTCNTAARNFVYGLPELNRAAIRSAQNIANPGCFATAIQLGLLPMAKEGYLPPDVYTTGITGSTGAGHGFSQTSHFSWRANNIQAYKVLSHQHLGEISQSLKSFNQSELNLHFVPWRGDFTRGMFISSTLDCDLSQEQVLLLYKEYYNDHPFVTVTDNSISLKAVVNTNKCLIQLEKVGRKLVVHSTIDNLLKGASGQAVQNMNIMFGFDELAGLQLKASAF